MKKRMTWEEWKKAVDESGALPEDLREEVDALRIWEALPLEVRLRIAGLPEGGEVLLEGAPTAPEPVVLTLPPASLPSKIPRFLRTRRPPPPPPPSEGPLLEFPPLSGPHVQEVERYAVQDPYAYVRILYDESAHEYIYEVVEPLLSDREKNVLEFVKDTLVDALTVGLRSISEEEGATLLRRHVDEILRDYGIDLSPLSHEKVVYYILRDFLGHGRLEPLMRDDLIEDISCDGPGIPVFLYHRKYESLRSSIVFPTAEELDSFVIRIAQRSGKHISIANPLLDATLPDGSRLNATLSHEVTSRGSTFTIRKFREDPFTPTDLLRFKTMSPELLAYWWIAVQNGASAIYAGGTASGKTTSLNAILLFIPPQVKIVSIEDTREINIPHENWIPAVTRSGYGPKDASGRQSGEIDMFTLLKAALRQRPEYILVGEIRGEEAYALFQAMATGHTAYGTMHADSVESVIHRLESAPLSIPRPLLEALDIVSVQIQTRLGDRRVRRTKEVVEIVGLDPRTQEILTNEVFTWNPARDEIEFSGVSYVLERIQLERNWSEEEMRRELQRRKEILEILLRRNVRDYKAVGRIILAYYKAPEETFERLKKWDEKGGEGDLWGAMGEETHEGSPEQPPSTQPPPPEESSSESPSPDSPPSESPTPSEVTHGAQ